MCGRHPNSRKGHVGQGRSEPPNSGWIGPQGSEFLDEDPKDFQTFLKVCGRHPEFRKGHAGQGRSRPPNSGRIGPQGSGFPDGDLRDFQTFFKSLRVASECPQRPRGTAAVLTDEFRQDWSTRIVFWVRIRRTFKPF